jgi:hypothetical protein
MIPLHAIRVSAWGKVGCKPANVKEKNPYCVTRGLKQVCRLNLSVSRRRCFTVLLIRFWDTPMNTGPMDGNQHLLLEKPKVAGEAFVQQERVTGKN